MELKPLRCPSCGANLSIPDNAATFFCSYCGTEVVHDKKYIEVSGEVSVKGMVTVDSLLDRAYLFLEDGDFSSAKQYCERVLDIQPKTSKAYIGQLLCLLRLKSIDSLAKSNKSLKTYDLFNKALRFATPDESAMLCGYQEQVEGRLNAQRQEYEGKIRSSEGRISGLETQLALEKKEYYKATAKKALWIILIILSSLGAAFFTIGVLAAGPAFLIGVAPFVALLVLFIRKLKKANTHILSYEQSSSALKNETTLLEQTREQYKQWQDLIQ